MSKNDANPGVYCAIAGGGPRGTFLAGAVAGLGSVVPILGYSGASVGAILATLKAFAIPDDRIKALFTELLDGRFTDLGMQSLLRGGVLEWQAITEACDDVLGPGARLGDAVLPLVIGVTSLDEQCPMYLSKRVHPHVKVSEVLTASCAFGAGVTPACKIPSLSISGYSPDIRLFVDGGYTDNTVDGVWSTRQSATVLLRLAAPPPKRVRDGDVSAIASASIGSAFWAQSQPKGADLVINVPATGGWDFRKSKQRVFAECEIGRQSVLSQRESIAQTAARGH